MGTLTQLVRNYDDLMRSGVELYNSYDRADGINQIIESHLLQDANISEYNNQGQTTIYRQRKPARAVGGTPPPSRRGRLSGFIRRPVRRAAGPARRCARGG